MSQVSHAKSEFEDLDLEEGHGKLPNFGPEEDVKSSGTEILDALEGGHDPDPEIEKEERKRKRERRLKSTQSETSMALSRISSMGSVHSYKSSKYGKSRARATSSSSISSQISTPEAQERVDRRVQAKLAQRANENRYESTLRRTLSRGSDDGTSVKSGASKGSRGSQVSKGTGQVYVDKANIGEFIRAAQLLASDPKNPVNLELEIVQNPEKKKKKGRGICLDACLGFSCVGILIGAILIFVFFNDIRDAVTGDGDKSEDSPENRLLTSIFD